jgi:DNA-binding transcriptional regulator YhcF (GntR family)
VAPNPRIQIDTDLPGPVNRQIADQLRSLLVEGVFVPGDVLPSVRRLAVDLGVHFNTVADAYRTLAEEGWLDVCQGRSVRVLARRAPRAAPESLQLFKQRLRQIVTDARADGVPTSTIARELAAAVERVNS